MRKSHDIKHINDFLLATSSLPPKARFVNDIPSSASELSSRYQELRFAKNQRSAPLTISKANDTTAEEKDSILRKEHTSGSESHWEYWSQ